MKDYKKMWQTLQSHIANQIHLHEDLAFLYLNNDHTRHREHMTVHRELCKLLDLVKDRKKCNHSALPSAFPAKPTTVNPPKTPKPQTLYEVYREFVPLKNDDFPTHPFSVQRTTIRTIQVCFTEEEAKLLVRYLTKREGGAHITFDYRSYSYFDNDCFDNDRKKESAE